MKMTFVVDQKFLETYGHRTLVGKIHDSMREPGSTFPEVILEFPQTSLAWRQGNGGPDHIIMTEYVLPCLLEDIFWLQRRGVSITIATPTRA